MLTNSYEDWMRRPISSAVCPTPDLWPDVLPQARSRQRVFASDSMSNTPHREEPGMNEEKARILKMLEDKKITADEAMKLLDALDRTESRPSERDLKRKWLHIRVEKDGRQTVNIKLPLALLKFGFKFVPRHARKHAHTEARAERAEARAEKAREHAERVRAKLERRLRDKFGAEAEVNIDGLLDEVFGSMESELESLGAHGIHTNGVSATLDGIFNGDSDLDLDKILEMAQDPAFDGTVLDVYDDDEDEHVKISLE